MWVSNAAGDMRVRLIPAGTPHAVHANVVHAGGGRIQPRFGYQWAGNVAAGDYRVRLLPKGTPHAYYAHVVWNGSGDLRPAPGYTWASRTARDYRVVRIVVIAPPVNPIVGFLKKRERKLRRRRAFATGVDAYGRGDFERARDALREAVALEPENEQFVAYLERAEQGLRDDKRKEMAKAYRRALGADAATGLYVPAPRISELYRVRIPPATGAWSKYIDPLVDVGNTALAKLQDGAEWAEDVALNEARLQVDNKLKSLPGYDLYRSYQSLQENQELLQEGYAKRVIRMAARNLDSVRRAVLSAGGSTSDALAGGKEDAGAFWKLAGTMGERGADGKWVLSSKPRPPTQKQQHGRTRGKARHAGGFEVSRWRGR